MLLKLACAFFLSFLFCFLFIITLFILFVCVDLLSHFFYFCGRSCVILFSAIFMIFFILAVLGMKFLVCDYFDFVE